MLPSLPTSSNLNWGDSSLKSVVEFLQFAISICRPNNVEIFDGTAESYQNICSRLCASGQFAKLNPYTFPNSYIIRSNPIDVARSEDRTFVCLKEGEKLYQTPNSEIPKEVGFSYGCRAGEIDPETGKEMTTEKMRLHLYKQFDGCMVGRTLFVIPYSMGPVSSEYAKLGIQISDSAYVVVNMYTMTRTGISVLKKISEGHSFVPSWHSVGVPLAPGEKDVIWPCRLLAKDRYIVQFMTADPERPLLGNYSIMSLGSGYGGNAILGKKCYALRIASKMARDEPTNKWMAEHMLILRVTYTPLISSSPVKKYGPPEYFTITGAFPSACGKTNLAMLEVPKEFRDEWKVSTAGDDIAWIRIEDTNAGKGKPTYQFCAINAESGFFGVAPGTSEFSNKNAIETLRGGNCIFTNTAVTQDGDPYWEDKEKFLPLPLIDWRGKRWTEEELYAGILSDLSEEAKEQERKKRRKALEKSCSHGNSRYTTPCVNCPIIDKNWNTGKGYPIDAILFGGRRTLLMPLAVRTRSWDQGVLHASTLRSEGTAAVQDRIVGSLSFDPMAMRPFIGYNMGDYFQHWFDMGAELDKKNGRSDEEKAADADPLKPDIYLVNWFRKSAEGKFLWEGFSQNFRIIRWACLRAHEKRLNAQAHEGVVTPLTGTTDPVTPLGFAPSIISLGLDGNAVGTPASPLADSTILSILPLDTRDVPTLPTRAQQWYQELQERRQFLTILKNDLPPSLRAQFNAFVDEFTKYGLVAPEGHKIDELKL